jgi:streptogramin lyase
MSFPAQIAVDSNNRVLVEDNESHEIMIFNQGQYGNVTPAVVLGASSGLQVPLGVALGGSGGIWVSDNGSGTLSRFDADATSGASPTKTITSAAMTSPEGITIK